MMLGDWRDWVLGGWCSLLFFVVAWVLIDMSIRLRSHAICRFASDHRPWIILFVLVMGLLFGVIGEKNKTPGPTIKPESGQDPAQGKYGVGRLLDSLYEGAKQLTINGDVDANDSVCTRMARMAGLVAVILLAYEAIQLLFAKPLQRLWLGRQKRHIVICGLGRIGRSLIIDLVDTNQLDDKCAIPCISTRRPKSLVVIERDKDNIDIPWAEARGVTIVIGDAADEEVLKQVGADRAHDVFFVTGSDELNLESAYYLMRIVDKARIQPKARKQSRVPRMFVHLLNIRLESMLVQAKQRAFQPADDKTKEFVKTLTVQPFNVLDHSIQALVDGPIIDQRPTKDHEVAHFVIVGFGQVGQALAVKLAQLAHFENLKRTRMTIVYGKSDEEAIKQFKELYPTFFPNLLVLQTELLLLKLKQEDYDVWMPFEQLDDWSVGVSVKTKQIPDHDHPGELQTVVDDDVSNHGIKFVVNGGFAKSSGGVTCNEFISKLTRLSSTSGVRPMVFICHSDDEQNCADAKELRDELDLRLKKMTPANRFEYKNPDHRVTILPYVPNRPMLHELIDPTDKHSADLIPWGDCRKVCNYPSLTTDMYRPLAESIKHDFDIKYSKSEKPDEIPWVSLDDMLAWERHTNLMTAAHVNVKMSPLKLAVQPWIAGKKYEQPDRVRIDAIIARSAYHEVNKAWLVETEDDQLLEMIAKMEHHRWVAERLLMDWSFGARAAKTDAENKKRYTLADWENLLPTEGIKDRDQIARILKFCTVESNRPEQARRFIITLT